MAASRMQRWAVILAGYNYDIEYIRSEKNAADALSRLPVGNAEHTRKTRDVTYINFIQKFLPVTKETVRKAYKCDEILRRVYLYIQTGWPSYCKEEELKPYFQRREELYIDLGCIIWGYRLVIPKELTDKLLAELHIGHMGIVKMKSMARSIMWWPGIDADIERTCRSCSACTAEAVAPNRAPPQPWRYVPEPWSRLHVDFLGPYQGKTFLVLIDSTSKWLEIFLMSRTTASAVIKVLRETFARFGLPKEIVSDNGPPFSSKEYIDFMSNNGIKVTYTPIYHPSSNGAAEGAVKLCKRVLKKANREGVDIDVSLQAYLMAYRNVEHATTGVSPASLLQRRNLRSRLDLLREERQVESRVLNAQNKQVVHAGGTNREFQIGDTVMARSYAGGRKWVPGRIRDNVGSRTYIVDNEDGSPMRRHVDQLKKNWSAFGWPIQIANVASQGSEPSGPARPTQDSQSASTSDTQAAQVPLVPPVIASGPNLRPRETLKPVLRYGFEID